MTGASAIEGIRRALGLTEREEAAIRAAARRLAPEIEGWVERFYVRLVTDPVAMGILKDEARVIRLKRSLSAWFLDLLSLPLDVSYESARREIGRTHVRIGMPLYLMVTAMNGIRRDAVASVERLWSDDAREAGRIGVALGKVLDLELALMLEAYRRRSREVEHAQYAVLHAERIAARLVRTTRDAVDAALCYAELLLRSSEVEREGWAARLADSLRACTRAERLELSVAGSTFLLRSERASRLCDRALANVSFSHGTEVEVTLEPEDLVVVGDGERLQRALEELLQNAANHDPGGKVKLAVRRESEAICFEVSDTGAGWPAHVRTLDGLLASGGLGLTFCAYVADLHGGRVEIYRPEGAGAGVRLFVAGTPSMELFEHADLAEDSRRKAP